MTFRIGTDPDIATINVNNRVQARTALLPEEVRRQGVTVRKRRRRSCSSSRCRRPTSATTRSYLSNYALLNVLDELRRISRRRRYVQMFGAQDYSMRSLAAAGQAGAARAHAG